LARETVCGQFLLSAKISAATQMISSQREFKIAFIIFQIAGFLVEAAFHSIQNAPNP